MNGQVVPEQAKTITSWRSFFENKALVQFNHRNFAYLTSAVSTWLAYAVYKNYAGLPPMVRLAAAATFLMINYQVE
jgi:heme A synthase